MTSHHQSKAAAVKLGERKRLSRNQRRREVQRTEIIAGVNLNELRRSENEE